MSKVADQMEAARAASNGTMEMWVVFQTEPEVAEAEKWMKGKQKVKSLTPLTREAADARKAETRAAYETARKKLAKKGQKK
jgi:hypothetical protein